MAKSDLPQTQTYIDKYIRYQELYLRANKTSAEVSELQQLQTDLTDYLLLASEYNAIINAIGTLTSLNTTAKDNLVNAVNELKGNIGTLTSLNTAAKTNLVAAINEAFQFANDGKTSIATVVGSPASSSDTFTQLRDKIQTNKNTLATNLTAKGQSSAGTETLAALVAKVANVNTGKRYQVVNGTTDSNGNAIISGLAFQPSYIIIEFYYSENQILRSSYYADTYHSYLNRNIVTLNVGAGTISGAVGNTYTITSNGFTLQVSGYGNKAFKCIVFE